MRICFIFSLQLQHGIPLLTTPPIKRSANETRRKGILTASFKHLPDGRLLFVLKKLMKNSFHSPLVTRGMRLEDIQHAADGDVGWMMVMMMSLRWMLNRAKQILKFTFR